MGPSMTDELSLDLPTAAGEPRPWIVRLWRFKVSEDVPFVTREDAIDYALGMADSDQCYVEGPFAPDGTSIEREAFPWRHRDRSAPRRYTGMPG